MEVKLMPPILLDVRFPPSYPLHEPPSFRLSCSWLTRKQLSVLCGRLDALWLEYCGSPIVSLWADQICTDALAILGIDARIDLVATAAEAASEAAARAATGAAAETAVEARVAAATAASSKPTDRPGEETKAGVTGDADASCSDGDLGIDPRAVCLSAGDDAHTLVMGVIRHSMACERRDFQRTFHKCGVCLAEKLGSEFVRLAGCGHHFCRECISEFVHIHIAEGSVLDIKCPEPSCRALLPPAVVCEAVTAEEFERWEHLVLQRSLDAMPDLVVSGLFLESRRKSFSIKYAMWTPIILPAPPRSRRCRHRRHCRCSARPLDAAATARPQYCPRCENAVVEQASHLALCPKCHYAFCGLCRGSYHPGQCMTAEDRIKMLEARAGDGGGRKGDGAVVAAAARQQELQLLIAEAKNLQKAMSCSKPCPSCKMGIEKTEGCNKVHCTSCHSYMCYACGADITEPGYDHFGDGGRCALFSQQEVNRWEAEVRQEGAMDAAAIDWIQRHQPQAALRVSRCPRCRQQSLKADRNNHMRCWSCGTSYCFLCGTVVIKTSAHYGGAAGCRQHTD
ncbi:unnamed protein product [Phaeothamnion confervicola]